MVSQSVTVWADTLLRACQDVGAEVGLATLLALVATESSGDEHADNGTFRGLLQIGGPYLTDAREWLSSKRRPAEVRALLDEVPEHKDGLLGNARASAIVTCAYLERYEMRHGYDPHLVATIHKGGAGTAKTVKRELDKGVDLRTALERAEESRGVPNLVRYVLHERHFGGHLRDYSAWVDASHEPEAPAQVGPVCKVDEDDPRELLERALRLLAKREASS